MRVRNESKGFEIEDDGGRKDGLVGGRMGEVWGGLLLARKRSSDNTAIALIKRIETGGLRCG